MTEHCIVTDQANLPVMSKRSSTENISSRRNKPTRTQNARSSKTSKNLAPTSTENLKRETSADKAVSRGMASHRPEKNRTSSTNATLLDPGVNGTTHEPSNESISNKRKELRRTQSACLTTGTESSGQVLERVPSTKNISTQRRGNSRSNSDKSLNRAFSDRELDTSHKQELDLNSSHNSNQSRKNGSHSKTKTRDNTFLESSWTPLYTYARKASWSEVSQQCKLQPRDAQCVDPHDGTTALHLAVISRTNPTFRNLYDRETPPAPLELIEELAAACPEAAIIRCHLKTYTPLCYACSVYEREYSMQNAKIIVRILLEHAPQSAYVFTEEGLSALDIHILKASRLFKNEPTADSTIVLRTLLESHPRLAKTRCFNNQVEGPIEILYRTNKEKFKKMADRKVAPDSWWAWKWVQILLHHNTSRVNMLHAAAGLNGCPVAILKIAAQNHLEQLSQVVDEAGNMPLHEVCTWIDEQNEDQMTTFINRRKRDAIQCLLRFNSKTARVKNLYGESPLQLAIESRTPYPRGIEALIRAYPGALSVPRTLRVVKDENEKLLSINLYDDNESIDSDWENPVLAVEGMYPFMVAAVVAVDSSWTSRDVFLNKNAPNQTARWEKQYLASLETIYGLLRANPKMLELYEPVYVESNFCDTEDSSEEYTDEFVEESDFDYTEETLED